MTETPAPAQAGEPQGYTCPICQKRPIETAVTVPSIRGFLLAYQIRTRKVLACRVCARKAMLGEAGKSMLVGWFSPTSLIVNPAFILWNVGRAPFARANQEKVAETYRQLGVPVPGESVDIAQILYVMAASMIAADGKISPEEIETAEQIGGRILSAFDPTAFRAVVGGHKSLPDPERQARLLGSVLDNGGRALVIRLLYEIAASDGQIERREKRLLTAMGNAMYRTQSRFEDFERIARPQGAQFAA